MFSALILHKLCTKIHGPCVKYTDVLLLCRCTDVLRSNEYVLSVVMNMFSTIKIHLDINDRDVNSTPSHNVTARCLSTVGYSMISCSFLAIMLVKICFLKAGACFWAKRLTSI